MTYEDEKRMKTNEKWKMKDEKLKWKDDKMKMEKPQKNVGNAHSTKLFYPFCECLGTFSTLISYFFSLFYFIILSTYEHQANGWDQANIKKIKKEEKK